MDGRSVMFVEIIYKVPAEDDTTTVVSKIV